MSIALFDISVIIPFYKRDSYALATFEALKLQAESDLIRTEVIFVDSNSRQSNFDKFLINSKNIEYKIFDVDDYVSIKRNFGIEKAASQNIIIMDDDCLPQAGFLKDHLKEIQNNNDKIFFCGVINYQEKLVEKSNYFRFRDYQHRIFDEIYKNNHELNFHNIVVMNMGFKKSLFINAGIRFNEKYNTYGFDDIQFGLDALSKDFKIKTSQARVLHQDSTSLSKYYLKLRSFGKTYFSLFYKFNYKYFDMAYSNKNNIISKNIKDYEALFYLCRINDKLDRKSLSIKIILSIFLLLIKFLNLIIMSFLIITDKLKFLYSYRLFKFFVRMTLLESFLDKQKINKEWL